MRDIMRSCAAGAAQAVGTYQSDVRSRPRALSAASVK